MNPHPRKRHAATRLGVVLGFAGLVLAPLHVQAQARSTKSEIQLSFEKASGLTGAQKVEKAESMVQKMKDHLRRGFELLEQARSEKDIVKLNAINEKLSAMKGLLKISEAAYVALQEAVARRDQETANHEYTKVAIATQKVEALATEAEGAVGDSLHYTGDTRVEVTAEGFAAEGDVSSAGAGADVPAGAGAGATGAARSIAGGAETQTTPETTAEETQSMGDADGADGGDSTGGVAEGADDGAGMGADEGAAPGTDFEPPLVEDVLQPDASPTS